MIVGDIGYREHVVFTALGDPVNVAARLQDMTKEFSCDAVIAEDVCRNAGLPPYSASTREVTIRGRDRPLTVRLAQGAIHEVHDRGGDDKGLWTDVRGEGGKKLVFESEDAARVALVERFPVLVQMESTPAASARASSASSRTRTTGPSLRAPAVGRDVPRPTSSRFRRPDRGLPDRSETPPSIAARAGIGSCRGMASAACCMCSRE